MGMARTTRFAAILGFLLGGSFAGADMPDCPKSDMPSAAQKGLHKAARREHADPLDVSTLSYCAGGDVAHATVDTVPVPRPDGSEDVSTLWCSGPPDRARDWSCRVERYQAIRVPPATGRPEARVEVGERATLESTREYALQAFALLNQPGSVAACPGVAGLARDSASLRDLLARRHGPYRLVISREGFALLRAGMQVRFRSANAYNPRAQIQCWEEHAGED